MGDKRYLLIFIGKYHLDLLIARKTSSKVKILFSKKLRIYTFTYNFSICEYILEALNEWGNETGCKLVKENVPIIPRVGKNGVDDIFIFSRYWISELKTLSQNIFEVGKELKPEGAKLILDYTNFRNLLFISFDFDSTVIARYSKCKDGLMKVVAEKIKFDTKEAVSNINLYSELKEYYQVDKDLRSRFLNQIKVPIFNLNEPEEVLLEYVLANYKLKPFTEFEKLELNKFGMGRREDNLLVLGGEKVTMSNNAQLYILSILETLNLSGIFGLCIDTYGMFDFLQRSDEKLIDDSLCTSLILDYWGLVMTIRAKKSVKFDEELAKVNVKDGVIDRQIIPMVGRIARFTFLERGDIDIRILDNAESINKSKNLRFSNMEKNFVIDSRLRPVKNNFHFRPKSDLVISWMKSVGAL